LNEEFVDNTFIPFLLKYKNYIYDLYFTCRMPPFLQDAMGDTFIGDIRDTTLNALYISEQTGIPLSATFNNIQVVPSQENLDIFISHFKPVYDAGVRIATIPHTSWMMTGQIQKEFPELFVKNTILREVTRPNEIVSLAKAGFNYINLDRDLMRDRDSLIRIKEAKDYCETIGNPVKISLLANEGCWGGCPIMTEHYHYNNSRRPNNPQYFSDSISRVSCSKWDEEDPATSLKAANLPPWKKDWEEFIDLGIDVFKMHGRENAMRLKETMDIVERWVSNEEILFPQFNDYIEDVSIEQKPIDIWREKIKTCRFDCWKCKYCDSVIESRLKKEHRTLDEYVKIVLDAIDLASKNESSFDEKTFNIRGLSSNKVRHFLNNLCGSFGSVYLELGLYTGSTFFAAIENHNHCMSFAVDDFSQIDIKPFRDDLNIDLPNINLKDYFISNAITNKTCLLNKSILDVDQSNFYGTKPNIIFYDADHDPENQKLYLNHLLPCFANKFILILDDANFMGVIESADQFCQENNLKVLFNRKILTSIPEDENSWWNGLYIMVLEK